MSTPRLHLGRHLRLDDNPLLTSAAATQERLLPVFALDPTVARGPHQEAFLLASLADLQSALRTRGSDLLLLHEPPPADARDRYASSLRMIADAQLPFDHAAMPRTYTPFRQRVEAAGVRFTPPAPAPDHLPPLPEGVACPTIEVPDTPLIATGGASSAHRHWRQYRDRRLPDTYKDTRNGLLGWDYSSKLSAWLAWGCISPRRIAHDLALYEEEFGANDGTYWLWFELLWREHFRLLHLKHGTALYRARGLSQLPTPPHDEAAFQRWCEGRTGEPLVDAGMRELAATGWLSNRMRQIVASFLIHDLACDWRAGAAWFESRLIDFDVHSNQGNWLYVAGRDTDPRGGRRFNPDKQAREHDPDGAYRRSGALADEPAPASLLTRALGEYLARVDRVQQLVVLRTGAGQAPLLGVALDRARLPEIVGTIAGDDTILVIAPDVRRARVLARRLTEIAEEGHTV